MTAKKPAPSKDPVAVVFGIIALIALVAAVFFLAQFFASFMEASPGGSGSLPTPGPDEPDPQFPVVPDLSAGDLRELALALAAVITAITGLLGVVGTQIWRGREENRLNQSHKLALDRERLELERERLQLEKDRLEFERQRQAADEKHG